jgi:hypothetical protein
MRIVVIEHLTLDGVMQAPGAPVEDLRDDFEHGWAPPGNDEVMGGAVAVAEVEGPAAARALVDALDLDRYHLPHAVRGDLLRRRAAGRRGGARSRGGARAPTTR